MRKRVVPQWPGVVINPIGSEPRQRITKCCSPAACEKVKQSGNQRLCPPPRRGVGIGIPMLAEGGVLNTKPVSSAEFPPAGRRSGHNSTSRSCGGRRGPAFWPLPPPADRRLSTSWHTDAGAHGGGPAARWPSTPPPSRCADTGELK